MRLTKQRLAIILDALQTAEHAEQADAADAMRLVNRFGFDSVRKEAEARAKRANSRARAFSKLWKELGAE